MPDTDKPASTTSESLIETARSIFEELLGFMARQEEHNAQHAAHLSGVLGIEMNIPLDESVHLSCADSDIRLIADAIGQERERCAKIAEDCSPTQSLDIEPLAVASLIQVYAQTKCEQIAARIRSGE